MLLLVTGLPSPRKERFINALSGRVGAAHVIVGGFHSAHPESVLLHVHAESDAEGLVETGWRSGDLLHEPDLVVRLDWEPMDASVDRVLQIFQARTAAVGP